MDRYIIIVSYFVIYSFFGWLLESLYKSFYEKKFINSGFLAGPFCPIYGYGALIMYLLLNRFSNNLILLFISAFIVLSIFEYFVGVILEALFNTKYWDYSNYKFNIKGRVCLLNSMYWGILGVIFIKLIHPAIQGLESKIPFEILKIATIVCVLYILIDTIVTIVKILKINKKIADLDKITEKIHEIVPHLKEINAVNKTKMLKGIVKIKHTNQSVLDELEERKRLLIENLNRRTKRIRKAFPSMKSERFFKYLKLPEDKKTKIPAYKISDEDKRSKK